MGEVYFFDRIYFQENKSLYESLLKPINEFALFYSELGLKKAFTKELLIQSVKNLHEFTDSIRSELFTILKITKIPKMLLASMEEEINSKITQLEEKVKKIHDTYSLERQYSQYSLHLDYDLFEQTISGKFTYSEQKLKDVCSIFIETDNQKEAIKIMGEIDSKFKELQSILKDSQILMEPTQIFEYSSETFRVKPDIIGRLQ